MVKFFQALPNTEQEQHLLSQMMNAQSEINLFEGREKFIEGFRLGARFMLDTFVVENKKVPFAILSNILYIIELLASCEEF
ncbi:hypothetical protein HYG86_10900 [Alkalicella caledoniensis]|uniref:Uncharacterized protein n=1 Tax=Alkalicella caledoniensis TaxID=2731377 RepID=A0A7G9W970_ALKCA|nr:DUF6809 family protein [Alkalicella caledoniensis]QNO15232.1 hypothetical protein HYG86_10900 [Alkalicella caledoniensis]